MIWDAKINPDFLLIRIELLGERNQVRSAVGIRDVEDEAIRKNSGCTGNSEVPAARAS